MSPKQLCGVERAVELIGSKWVLLILHNLCTTTRGFNELLRLVDGISPRILSLRLKDLVEHGLVSKEVLPTNPPQVHYSLTSKGESLKSIIESLAEWGATV